MCRELAALGMDLARAAARAALRGYDTPVEQRSPDLAASLARGDHDMTILFMEACDSVRQAISLEAHIASGGIDRYASDTDIFDQPDCDDTGLEALERLDDELADETRSVPEILAAICRDLGIAAEHTELPRKRVPRELN